MYHICWQWANLNCVCTNLNWWSVLTEISGVINCFSAVSTEQCCASAASLWPCVHPSGTSWYCTKMAKCSITQQCLWTQVFSCHTSLGNSTAVTLTGVPNTDGVGENRRFSTNVLLYSRNVVHGRLIGTHMHSMEWYYFEWRWVTVTSLNHPIFYILHPFHIFVTSGDKDLKFGR